MKPSLMLSFSKWLLLALAVGPSKSNAITITLPLSSPCAEVLQKAKEPGSNHHDVMLLGVCLHTQWNATMAFDVYQYLLETSPDFAYVHVNLGAWFSLAGKPNLAIEQYELYFEKVGGIYGDQAAVDANARQNGSPCREGAPDKVDCVNALNNLASSHFSEGKNSSAVSMYLERAIQIGDDYMLTKVHANLGSHLSRIGDEKGAADAFIKSFWLCLKQNDVEFAIGLLARRALLIPTISNSVAQTELDRIAFEQRIRDVTKLARVGGSNYWNNEDKGDLFRLQSGASNPDDIRQIPVLAGKLTRWSDALQTPHFFVHYKGYYDLPIQQQVFAMFTELCPPNLFEVAPHLLNPGIKLPSPKKKVGFISSLIGDDEPHGLLVLDVIRSLSKTSYFEFFVISNGHKAPSEQFYRVTNNNVFTVGYDHSVTRNLLLSLELDCLVYLEAMNDAMMYFLGYQRFADVQILAMGSPVTSGVETFDYFVSGDLLEHPFRTQMIQDHYSEQVVLMDGQAISFPSNQHHPRQDAALAAGDAHSLSMSPLEELRMLRRRNGHVYLCYQSIFKLQPLFDHVLADILIADYQGHIVLQASRHSNQTSAVATRLQTVLKERLCGISSFECPAMTDAYSRVHFIGRVTSDTLIDVLQQASVILHPFPFGGSKTAFDAINAATPMVTYPQQYLRGRMAAVFLRFLDLNEIDPDAGSCCIANSISDYVVKAIRLASDESYRTRVSKAFQERRTRIFDDKFIALEWGKLLTRALNIRASEEAILSQIHFSRKSYQQDDYFAKKVEEEQMRWSRNAMLSSVTSPH